MRALFLGFVSAGLLLAASGCSHPETEGAAAVTRAEYAAGVQAAADCVAAEGFEVGAPTEGPTGLLTFGIGGGTSKEAEARMDSVFDSCWSKHAQAVEGDYVTSLALTGEAWEAQYKDFITCLDKAGVEGVKVGDPEGVVGAAIGDNFEVVMCMQQHMFQLFVGQDGR